VTEPAPTPRPSAPGARDQILAAAVRRIANEGIDDVRIARIARDAGVSPPTVHYHFDSRDALLAEALRYSYDRVGHERLPDTPREPRAPRDRLHDLLEGYLPLPGEQHQDWMLWMELWLRAMRHPDLRPTSAALYRDMHEWIRDAIAEGIEDGSFAACDPDDVADQLLAMIDGCGVRVLIGDPAMDLDRMRAVVWRFITTTLELDA
jgi:AcrR family transcriptional regulator